MYQDIKRNKMMTGFIISAYIIILTLIIYYICYALDFGVFSIVFALIASISSAWGSYYYSDKIVLRINNARPATEEENKRLIDILDALMVSSGLPTKPKLYIMESDQPNAFATGRDPNHSVICVTTALLDKLDYYELEGVVAHEMGHIKNYDIRLSAVLTVMVGLVIILSDFFSRAFLWGRFDDDDNGSNALMVLISIVLLMLAAFFGKLMKLAISRKREFMADATAVEFTRNPDALISALEKLDSDTSKLKQANNSTENMYIVTPFKGKQKKANNWFSTHPSIEDRIEAIRTLR
ncbi:MAG TPA: M48 family metallopeptidase [Clostridiaceae bacterium]|jgi:heat shock protein HtpX|nr:M48 family metallopeptidase [Clostridium sp.]HJJ12021.1 M48 family metallopeptidase [Clostridiaceae bacterium]